MFEYFVLDIAFLLLAASVTVCLRTTATRRQIGSVLVVMIVLTAIFDQLLVGLHIVAYHTDHVLGLYIYKAPIEDFAYTVVASLTTPVLWLKLKGKHAPKNH